MTREQNMTPERIEELIAVYRDGRVSAGLKGNIWKGPFHVPRMQWYCWQLLDEMKAESGQ